MENGFAAISEDSTFVPEAEVVYSADMSLSQNDREWIQHQVWKTVVTTALCVVGVIAIFFLTEWKQYTEFRVHTGDRLDNIDAEILVLRAPQSPGAVLNKLGTLNEKEFSKSLPALRKVAEQPVSQVIPNPTTLRNVQVKLRSVGEDSPDYWPTVLQFIKFASADVSPDVPPPGPPGSVISQNTGYPSLGEVTQQVVLLDGGTLADARFVNCRIIFTENSVHMKNVTFENCVFELPVTDKPNPYLKQIGQQLLASDLTSVSIGVA